MTLRLDLVQRGAHGAFQRVMGDQHERGNVRIRLRPADCRAALYHTFNRDAFVRKGFCYPGQLAWPVAHFQGDIIPPGVRAHGGAGERHELVCGHAKHRQPDPARDIADVSHNG